MCRRSESEGPPLIPPTVGRGHMTVTHDGATTVGGIKAVGQRGFGITQHKRTLAGCVQENAGYNTQSVWQSESREHIFLEIHLSESAKVLERDKKKVLGGEINVQTLKQVLLLAVARRGRRGPNRVTPCVWIVDRKGCACRRRDPVRQITDQNWRLTAGRAPGLAEKNPSPAGKHVHTVTRRSACAGEESRCLSCMQLLFRFS